MKSIHHFATLFYYDGVQIFEGRDAIGGHYLALMIEPVEGEDCYFLAGVEPNHHERGFRSPPSMKAGLNLCHSYGREDSGQEVVKRLVA